jgi:hypothetical protein
MEEAALIQPGYYWPVSQIDAGAYEPGELSLERDGLRYSNFRLQAQNYNANGFPISTGPKPTLAGLGLTAGSGTFVSPSDPPFPQHVPMGTHWIAIGGTRDFLNSPPPAIHSLRASAAAGTPFGPSQLVIINFDVTPVSANQRITGISQSNYRYWQGFRALMDGDPPTSALYHLITTASTDSTSLASLQIDHLSPGAYFERQSDTKEFAAQQHLEVESRVFVENGVRMDAFLLDFNVVTVPEPAIAFYLAVLVVSYLSSARVARSKTWA